MTVEFSCFDEYMYSYYRRIYDTLTKPIERTIQAICEFVKNNDVRVKDAIEMHLAVEPFKKMKSGEKTVEIRLYDEKRRRIKVGDSITFFRGDNCDEWITATVIGLHRFQSFKELFFSDLFSKTGYGDMTPEDATDSMYHYYTCEQEKKFGVLAIVVKCK